MEIMYMEVRSIAISPSNSLPLSQQRIEIFSELYTATMVLVSIVMLIAMSAAIYDLIPKRIQHFFSLNLPSKVPCHKCRYFNPNPYIKCALYPSNVLKKPAVDCRDYDPIIAAQRVEK
jgi:hypothetical protein